jgi:hypothetical protein
MGLLGTKYCCPSSSSRSVRRFGFYFVPATPEATELFVEKQKFVYAIFDKILLTDKAKLLVRQYVGPFDAQKVFCDLTVYSNTSTMAARVAPDLLTYISSSKFGDGTWKGTAQGFILNWQDKVRQYESILPTKDHLTATIKRNLLENAVGQVQELRAIKTQAAQHKTQNAGIELSYAQYCSLLPSAVQEYDGSLVRYVKQRHQLQGAQSTTPSLSRAKLRTNFLMWPMTLIPASMTSLKSMSMALEVLDSMLTNGVVSLRKHKRNGTS